MTPRLLLLLLLLLSQAGRGQGWGDWTSPTPGHGGILADNGTGAQLATGPSTLYGVRRWYFYRGYVVGQYQRGYFLLADQEKQPELQLYTTEARWLRGIEARQLRPRLWMRWYRDDWRTWDKLPLMLLLNLPWTLLGAVGFGGLLVNAIRQERLTPYKLLVPSRARPYTAALGLLTWTGIGYLLLSFYPYSL